MTNFDLNDTRSERTPDAVRTAFGDRAFLLFLFSFTGRGRDDRMALVFGVA
jgi:hypothetical protein